MWSKLARSGIGFGLVVGSLAFGQAQAPAGGQPPAGGAAPVQKFTEIKEFTLKNAQGQQLGKVQDLVVDAKEGKVLHAVLAVQGVQGLENQLVVVPFTNLKANPQEKSLTLNLSNEQLQGLPKFEKEKWQQADPKMLEETLKAAPPPQAQAAPPHASYQPSQGQSGRQMAQATGGQQGQAGNLHRFDQIKNYQVRSNRGEDLGKVQDLILDNNGRVSHVVLAVEGVLGMEQKLVAVPMQNVKVNAQEKSLTLNIPTEQLQQQPSFDKNQWKGMDQNQLKNQLGAATTPATGAMAANQPHATQSQGAGMNQSQGAAASQSQASASGSFHKFSSLQDKSVTNDQGQDLGKIEDLAVDLSSGQVVSLALSFGGFLGFGGKTVAVPFQQVRVDAEKDTVHLNMDKQSLRQAPSINKKSWPQDQQGTSRGRENR